MVATARILTLLGLCSASAAAACRFGFACEPWIAPRDGTTIPANTLAFVAGSLDAGLLNERPNASAWFLAGELMPGSQLDLVGTDCQGEGARSRVTIGGPAALPTRLGEVSFEETGRDEPLNPCDERPRETVTYRMRIDPDPLVGPWLPVARFGILERTTPRTVRQTLFGGVTASADGALAIDWVTLRCSAEPVTLAVSFEVAGATPVSTDVSVQTPCQPGCSASGGASMLAALALWCRRRRAEARPGHRYRIPGKAVTYSMVKSCSPSTSCTFKSGNEVTICHSPHSLGRLDTSRTRSLGSAVTTRTRTSGKEST